MNIPRFAAAAAKLLRGSLSDQEPVAGDRGRGIATIERAVRSRAHRRRLNWSGGVLAAAAAVFLLIWAGNRASEKSKTGELVSINVSPAGRGAAPRAGEHA